MSFSVGWVHGFSIVLIYIHDTDNSIELRPSNNKAKTMNPSYSYKHPDFYHGKKNPFEVE